MSRIGRQPISLPAGVSLTIDGRAVTVKGKLGTLSRDLPEGIELTLKGSIASVQRSDESRSQRALHGLTRSLIANMVKGVSEGFKKDLEVVGVGYRAEQRGQALQLAVGFSHRVLLFPPPGIAISVGAGNTIAVSGIDKELVGEVAAKIRAVRPPEPYKGKGIKYAGEIIRKKAGKSAGK
ncbi:MAG: 50S ribosomal protein L6 [Calditrichaeota bacterium]|nr:50S ribosomal protein L6 [Calditrichota bacterium]